MEDTEHESSKEGMVSPTLPAPQCPDSPAWLLMHFMLRIRSSFRTDTQGILVHLEVVRVSKIVGT